MSVLDAEKVAGRHLLSPSDENAAESYSGSVLEPADLPTGLLDNVLSMRLEQAHGQWLYRLTRDNGPILVDALDGTRLVFARDDARAIATRDYAGDGQIANIVEGMAPDLETRNNSGPYWRVNFDDEESTSIYVSASSGEVLQRRNSYWRTFDFFWMLHIMDYSGHQDFNHPLIILFALTAIWIGISGMIILFDSFNRHDFDFLRFRHTPGKVMVSLSNPALDRPRQFSLKRGANLFLALAQQDIYLTSVCGGGGNCGRCKVRMKSDNLPAPNAVEKGLISQKMLEMGFRLACQQQVSGESTLYVTRNVIGNTELS
jgi:ferredoxin